MGLFKLTSRHPLPEKAEIQDGLVYWKDRSGKERTGTLVVGPDGSQTMQSESAFWSMRFRDASGRTVTLSTGCKDKGAALQVYAAKLRQVELVKSGTITQSELDRGTARSEPIGALVDAFQQALLDRGASHGHAIETARYVRRVADGLGVDTLRDLTREALEGYLGRIRADGASARSRNAHKVAMGTFGTWLQRTGRAEVNPYGGVPRLNEQAARVRVRRALSEDEITRLLAVARNHYLKSLSMMSPNGGPVTKARREVVARRTFRGRARELYYQIALTAGLRAGELEALRVGDLNLDTNPATLTIRAEESKNGRQDMLPLHGDVATQIKKYLVDRLRMERMDADMSGKPQPLRLDPMDRLLTECPTLKSFEADCIEADIPLVDQAGRTVDRHALRHTFCTRLARGGATVAVAQRLMRHADPKITMGFYTHLDMGDLAHGLDCLPTTKKKGKGKSSRK